MKKSAIFAATAVTVASLALSAMLVHEQPLTLDGQPFNGTFEDCIEWAKTKGGGVCSRAATVFCDEAKWSPGWVPETTLPMACPNNPERFSFGVTYMVKNETFPNCWEVKVKPIYDCTSHYGPPPNKPEDINDCCPPVEVVPPTP